MALEMLKTSSVLIELGQSSLKATDGKAGLELPLERQENGRITPACREQVIRELRRFLNTRDWLPARRALCAIAARGATLRRLSMPSARAEELERLLELQIESEFPISPDELAWGYQPLDNCPVSRDPSSGREVIVVALKKELVEDYSEMLAACGLNPIFTLGALARIAIQPASATSRALLDIGRHHSELILFEAGAPTSMRILPWGGENLSRAIASSLGVSRDEAEGQKIALSEDVRGAAGERIESALEDEAAILAELVRRNWSGGRLLLTGKTARIPGLAERLGKTLGSPCERGDLAANADESAAILGLKKWLSRNGEAAPLFLRVRQGKEARRSATPAQWQWGALAALLGVVLLSLLYAEPFIRKARLSRRLAEVRTFREKLPAIDRELTFLEFLSSNQPPYLDAMFVLANAAGPGTRINSLTMNRRGELSLRATMQVAQATEFRSKLIDSGFFANVVMDELTPNQDRQQVTLRISALWKPPGARPALPSSETRPTPGPQNQPPARSGSAPPPPAVAPTAPTDLKKSLPAAPQDRPKAEPRSTPERPAPHVQRMAGVGSLETILTPEHLCAL